MWDGEWGIWWPNAQPWGGVHSRVSSRAQWGGRVLGFQLRSKATGNSLWSRHLIVSSVGLNLGIKVPEGTVRGKRRRRGERHVRRSNARTYQLGELKGEKEKPRSISVIPISINTLKTITKLDKNAKEKYSSNQCKQTLDCTRSWLRWMHRLILGTPKRYSQALLWHSSAILWFKTNTISLGKCPSDLWDSELHVPQHHSRNVTGGIYLQRERSMSAIKKFFVIESDGIFYIMDTVRDPQYYAQRLFESTKDSECAAWIDETLIRESSKLNHRCPGAPIWI